MVPSISTQAQVCGGDCAHLKSGPWSIGQSISWIIRQFSNELALINISFCYSWTGFVVVFVCFSYEGGTLLTLSGFGFNENSKVLVGNETCNVIEGDLNRITCRTPKVRPLVSVIFFLSLKYYKWGDISVWGVEWWNQWCIYIETAGFLLCSLKLLSSTSFH